MKKRIIRLGTDNNPVIISADLVNNKPIQQIIYSSNLNQIFISDSENKLYVIHSTRNLYMDTKLYSLCYCSDIPELNKILYLIGCSILESIPPSRLERKDNLIIREMIISSI